MGYVIAAYAVTVAALGGYAIHLARERLRLSREPVDSAQNAQPNSG